MTPTWGLRIKGWDDYYGAWNAYWGGPRSANNGWECASATGALTCTYVYAAVGPQIVADGTCGDNLTWTLDDTGLLTISGSGDMTVYTASWGVNPTPWADYTKRISAISLPDGLTSISRYAFYGISSMTEISIPTTVTDIGEHAFENCSGLVSVSIPEGVTEISNNLFYDCTGLTAVTIPSTVNSIDEWAFYGCSSLESVVIPTGVTVIPSRAFSGCTSLASISLPEGLTTIEDSSFMLCAMTDIVIPSTVTSIGDYAFANCPNLTGFTIPEGVSVINSGLFSNCPAMTVVTIPVTVTSVGDYAFNSCRNLTDVQYGGTETDRTQITFGSNNEKLQNATWHYHGAPAIIDQGTCGVNLTWTLDADGVLTIFGTGEMADFLNSWDPWYNKGVVTAVIEEGVTSIGGGAFAHCAELTSVSIPISVTTIGDDAFSSCSSLTSVTIPAGVTSIGSSAFIFSSSLETISVADGNLNYCSIDGSLYSSDGTELCAVPGAKTGGFTIPEGVTSINDRAFQTCGNLTEITIPASVTSIGEWAFGYCESLESLTIPAGVESIANALFCNCTSLASVSIPESVVSIGENAFFNCAALTDVYYGGTKAQWDALGYQFSNSTPMIHFEKHTAGTPVRENVIPATAETEGSYDEVVYCSVCGAEISRESKTIPKIQLDKPVISSVSNAANGVQIKWKAVPGAAQYRVYRKTESSSSWSKVTDTTATSCTDTKTESGTTYIYSVRCLSSNGSFPTSAMSGTKSIKYIAAPALPTASNVSGGVQLNWTAVPGAEKYRVFRKVEGGSWAKLGDTAETTYTDTTGESGTKYFYTIRCVSADGKTMTSAYNTTGKSIVFYVLGTPGLPTLSNVTGGVRISWTAVNGAEKYRVFRKVEGGSWAKLADTTGTAYTDKTGEVGTKYFYTIRCIASDGKTYTSAYNTTGKSIVFYVLGTPGLPTLSNVTGGVRISWTAVNGAEKYRVFRKVEGGSWAKLVDTTGTAYTDKTGVVGTKYFYTIRCLAADGKSYTSANNAAGKSIVYYELGTPGLPTLTDVTGGIRISWTAINNAEKYRVFRKAEGGNWAKLVDTTGTAYTDKSGEVGTKYFYTIRCISTDGKTYTSAYNTTGKSMVFYVFGPPALPTLSKVSGGVKITWTATNGAEKYRVFRKAEGGSWVKVADTTGTAYTDKSGVSGTTYYYTIRCISADGKTYTSAYNTTGRSIVY